MSFDTFCAIACLIGTVLSYIGYRHCCENVFLKYQK